MQRRDENRKQPEDEVEETPCQYDGGTEPGKHAIPHDLLSFGEPYKRVSGNGDKETHGTGIEQPSLGLDHGRE